jgi:hypothetical protein
MQKPPSFSEPSARIERWRDMGQQLLTNKIKLPFFILFFLNICLPVNLLIDKPVPMCMASLMKINISLLPF